MSKLPSEFIFGLEISKCLTTHKLKKGEIVLELGDGSDLNTFLASKIVGNTGRVIGVYASSEMVKESNEKALENKCNNVEFRQGDMECLPVDNESIDLIISKYVNNFATNKNKFYQEAHRVLKPGGTISMVDLIVRCKLASSIEMNAGILTIDEIKDYLNSNGFVDIELSSLNKINPDVVDEWNETEIAKEKVKNYMDWTLIQARKPELNI